MERYVKLFTAEPRLYSNGSPVIIEAGALHKDTTLDDIVLQLKFRSVSDADISSLTVDVTCFNAANEVVVAGFTYRYTDISIDNTTRFFGQKTLITLPDNSIRSVKVRVTEATFSDGSSITLDSEEWESVPEPTEILSYGSNFEKYFKQKYGEKSIALPLKFKDLWLCSCGRGNNKDDNCSLCGNAHDNLFPFDLEREKKDSVYSVANEHIAAARYDMAIQAFGSIPGWRDSDKQIEFCEEKIKELKAQAEAAQKERARLAEEQRIKSAKALKLVRNLCIVAVSLVCVIVAFIIVLNTVIIPNGKYNDAIALMEAGKYAEAITAFEEIIDFKDSSEQKKECLYQRALIYRNDKNWDEANLLFEEIGEYKDSKSLIHYHAHEVIDSKDENCTTAGYKTYECNCGDRYTDTLPALGHNYSNATCTTAKKCSHCGKTEGSALGHITGAAKCLRSGCGAVLFKTLKYSGSGDRKIKGVNFPEGEYIMKLTYTKQNAGEHDRANVWLYAGSKRKYVSAIVNVHNGKTDKESFKGPASDVAIELNVAGDGGGSWVLTIEAV